MLARAVRLIYLCEPLGAVAPLQCKPRLVMKSLGHRGKVLWVVWLIIHDGPLPGIRPERAPDDLRGRRQQLDLNA